MMSLTLLRSGLRSAAATAARPMSLWASVPEGPPDPIFGVTEAFRRDTSPVKINLGVGAYRDDNNKPFVLSSVRKAEEKILTANNDKEYAAITGVDAFTKLSAKLAFGDACPLIAGGKLVTVQTISGTGALRVGFEFLNRFHKFPGGKNLCFPNPTWGNHMAIAKDSSLTPKFYNYYDPKTIGLNFQSMMDDLNELPNGSAVVFHACAHNPTGVDPTLSQWEAISKLSSEKSFVPFFDLAYQGFASGDCDRDAAALRLFVKDGHLPLVTQSYAKNMGLYGERIGALSVACDSPAEAKAIESQLKIIIRPMYSNPPIHGARIVSTILSDASLRSLWLQEVKTMADRINGMRRALVDGLKRHGSKKDWSHITNQIGMFCFSGLNPDQVARLASEFHVYLTKDGRISVAGITSKNVDHLAKSIYEVTK